MPIGVLDDPEPVLPVPVPVPEVDPLVFATFCNTPRSISEPPFRMTPCSEAAVLLVPNASVNITVMVQSEFTT
jgi:hypothetical protein